MRRMLRAWSRYRPRALTLVAFLLASAMLVLANLSFDETAGRDYRYDWLHYRSYGWPLIWHRLVLSGVGFLGGERAIGWYYSLPRLAVNLALWMLLLGALAGTCEWLLRRYRPRPRWSLRGLLVFVAMAGVLVGWYAHARNRAAIQDPLIPLQAGYGMPVVFVDRSGPKWLDVLGLDGLRRRIVLAHSWQLRATEPGDEQRFLQLARCPELRHLVGFHVDELTPTTAKALGGMRHLETLQIDIGRLTPDVPAALSELRNLRGLSIQQAYSEPTVDDDYARLADECLAAIGNLTNLESLDLSRLPVHGKSLACLADLKNLKSLEVDFWDGEWNGSRHRQPSSEDCLRAIATLKQLECLSLANLKVSNESLSCLDGLADLKILCLHDLEADERPLLSHLPALPGLKALDLSRSNIDDDDLRRLAVVPHLRSISLGQVTRAGLRALASVESLEEIELPFDFGSPEDLASVGFVKRLKKLHLMDTSFGRMWRELKLDDGQVLHVDVDAFEGFQRALEAIRQSKPGIIINGDGISFS